MGVALVQPLHRKVCDEAHTDGRGKEEHRIEEHLTQAGAGAGTGTQHTGQHHDADDIINDCRAHDGRAEEALQMAHLLQSRHRDGNAGGRHDGANEKRLVKLRAAHGSKPIEDAIKECAARQRHSHTHAGDKGGNGAGFDQLLQVGAKAGGEHQQHHADLRKDRDGITDVDQIQHTGADQQARDDLAHHLRGLALAGHQPEELGREDDDGEVSKDRIHSNDLPLLNFAFFTPGRPDHASWPTLFYIITCRLIKIKTIPAKIQLKFSRRPVLFSCRFFCRNA